jgi:predicted Zn-dependent protease with MMP-like domain
MVSRSDAFDALVLEVAERLTPMLGTRYADTEFAVEEVPPGDPLPWEESSVLLGRLFAPEGRHPARIVVYRRPIESRGLDESERAALVSDVVTEHVAALLGVGPEDLPPRSPRR